MDVKKQFFKKIFAASMSIVTFCSGISFHAQENLQHTHDSEITYHQQTLCNYESQNSDDLLEKEKIDVVIKYIDLTDPNLKRAGIPQITKDEDNGELKYCVRSVLKNIPWVNKIYIIMPNEKVRYFKNAKSISDKIVYINDKDLLGFDSAAVAVFEFNFWKLKKFGVSKNFIYLNDDYFIGKPLKKSDFFYEENGKIKPYVIFNNPIERNQYDKIHSLYKHLQNKVSSSIKSAHSGSGFAYQNISSYMFLYSIFGKSMKANAGDLAYFPHNALGENMDQLEEVYNIVKSRYIYKDDCLKAVFRKRNALVHQTTYNFYIINKYNERIKKLRGDYIDLGSVGNANFNVPLFCINTGGDSNYTTKQYATAKIMMEKLFPIATRYEKNEIEDGIYEIVSCVDEGKCIDISGASGDEGANLQLWERNNTNAQRFMVRHEPTGTCTMTCMCSGKNLEAEQNSNICQYSNSQKPSQKWKIISADRNSFYIVSAQSYLCMDVNGAISHNGTNIQCWEPNGTNAQRFRFVKIKSL